MVHQTGGVWGVDWESVSSNFSTKLLQNSFCIWYKYKYNTRANTNSNYNTLCEGLIENMYCQTFPPNFYRILFVHIINTIQVRIQIVIVIRCMRGRLRICIVKLFYLRHLAGTIQLSRIVLPKTLFLALTFFLQIFTILLFWIVTLNIGHSFLHFINKKAWKLKL